MVLKFVLVTYQIMLRRKNFLPISGEKKASGYKTRSSEPQGIVAQRCLYHEKTVAVGVVQRGNSNSRNRHNQKWSVIYPCTRSV